MPISPIRRSLALLALLAGGLLSLAGTEEPAAAQEKASAVFAGGCFWCVESDFEKLGGVSEAVSGYSGGDLQKPTYENHTGHLEAVEVFYDPAIVSYRQLVDYLLRHIDPLDAGGQFCDRGHSYTSAIFVANDEERADAEAAVAEAERILGEKIATPILPRGEFWDAEGYHQDYYKKNSLKYHYYRAACGRDRRVKKVWGED